jgi:HD-GYP domain-containing protein (c-di-GMP phosphodiesterase class II)
MVFVPDDIPSLIKIVPVLYEIRDPVTAKHSTNIFHMAQNFVKTLDSQGLWNYIMGDIASDDFQTGALLHDIGKLIIPDSILLKQDRLTANEYKSVKLHPTLGIEYYLMKKYHTVADIIHNHHQQIDGHGYPVANGKNHYPSCAANIISILDVYSALRENRLYKKSFSNIDALNIMTRDIGIKFDPHLTELVFSNLATICDDIFSDQESYALPQSLIEKLHQFTDRSFLLVGSAEYKIPADAAIT